MKHGDDNIMSTLQKKTWLTQDKYKTHREASIGFIKYISTVFAVKQVAKAHVVNVLVNFELTKEEISTLSKITKYDMVTTNTTSKKRSTDGQPKVPVEDINNQIAFPAFDLPTKKIDFGNSPHRVTTIVYEIKCHPDHSALLKVLLIRASVLDKNPPSDSTIHFIPYGLINVSDSNTVKYQIIQQNQFIHNNTIILIHNIDEDTMYSRLKEKLENIPSVTNIEQIYISSTSGKWLVITTQKKQSRHDIDDLINNTTFLPNIERPDRSNRYNINTALVSYATTLQKKSIPREQKYNHAPNHAFKRKVNISYDVEDERVSPKLNNNKTRKK